MEAVVSESEYDDEEEEEEEDDEVRNVINLFHVLPFLILMLPMPTTTI